MLFSFIKYISPGWYFNLKPKGNIPYFTDYELLTESQKSLIDFDENYSSVEVSKLDAAYQGFWKGLITEPKLKLNFLNIKPTISDNYRFVKKNYNRTWVYYNFHNKNPYI